ncbi:MAG TPA: energy transducer TonB [Verrucomicrobiae bacterium]|jgi:protein TonB|nr:energy transducer TonB [Verrucomicrobiae bacterium]
MTNAAVFDVLDQAIGQLIARPGARPAAGADLAELLQIAADLRQLPRTEFKARLGVELEWAAAGRTVSNGSRTPAAKEARLEFLPGLLGRGFGIYPVRRANFAASLALHAALVACFALGLLTIKNIPRVDQPRLVTAVDSIVLPPGSLAPRGGGGGGSNDPKAASQGELPRTAREQLTPPTVIEPRKSRLPEEATIVAPDLNVPAPKQMGDTLSRLTTLSDGTGSANGVGSGDHGGVGPGHGPGHGPGSDGNWGDGSYRTGNGVIAPRALYSPEPEFSEEARKVKHQGTVVLWAVIGTDGRPHNIRVEQSLGMGLDEKALEAVRTWRFEPGTKDGRPVSVQMNIVVNFHLY